DFSLIIAPRKRGRGGSTRRDLGGSFASPHAVVGIFIVNNSPETMAGRFFKRRFASRSRVTGALPRGCHRFAPSFVLAHENASAQQKARRGLSSGRLA